jgi:hypothetical protein
MNNLIEVLDKRQTGEHTCSLTVRVTYNYQTYPLTLQDVPLADDVMDEWLSQNRQNIIDQAIAANQAAVDERLEAAELMIDLLLDTQQETPVNG